MFILSDQSFYSIWEYKFLSNKQDSNLKLGLYDKNNYKYTEDKNLVSNQYTILDSSLFSHSDCGSSPVKTYANKRALLEEKKWHTVDSNQQPLDYNPNAFQTELRRLVYIEWELNFY